MEEVAQAVVDLTETFDMFRAKIAVVANESDTKNVTLEITPPRVFSHKVKFLTVPYEQYLRVCEWYNGMGNIQNVLHDMPEEHREMLMTGMDNAEWARMTGDDNALGETVSQQLR